MASYNVTIKNFAFSPSQIEIKQGDKVIWTSEDTIAHTVTADGGEFDSGDMVKGDAPFEHTFGTTGEIPYHCDHHGGMRGKVTVKT
ncbi:hypothetical protein AOQ72_02935 [Bradyrhizobium yuanmingense]|uniref:Blue (type 1) copper domain-containing protein n=1 Tax=Bradyrhizobium yuanmingense TaxID=108015 RepID=A0A0R3BVZ1_9BRAD|nr:plastocyanin/azurin family copper-binding protein [Bradyrhizobium yuanmingense]KRP86945.1 hypothetical protein AOQ72_02935 [Bradyrhizobium yuanmingense]